jgi:hypothetical protein
LAPCTRNRLDIAWLQQLLDRSPGKATSTCSRSSARAADLRSRPAVSAAYLEGDTFGVFTHGEAEFLAADHVDRGWIEDHLTRHYGTSPSTWGPDIVYERISPSWMVGYDGQRAG